MKRHLVILLAATSVFADLYVLQDSRNIPGRGQCLWTNDLGSAILLDYATSSSDQWAGYKAKKGWRTPDHLPAVVDDEDWSVSYATEINAAIADHISNQSPARKALRQLLGEKPTKKAIRQAQRQAERGWTTATTFAIYLRARTNELHLIKLIDDFQDEVEAAK